MMKPKTVDAVKFSVYFHRDQVEYLKEMCEKEGVSRSRYIEMKCFPETMWRVNERKKGKKD